MTPIEEYANIPLEASRITCVLANNAIFVNTKMQMEVMYRKNTRYDEVKL